jgi:hypothetical protein
MGNNKATKRTAARRAATFMAVLGALVLSSGVALMATATSANAVKADKIVVCKYVDTPGGQLQGGNNPIEVSLNTLNNVVDDDWLADPTFPKSWNDAHGQSGGSIAIGFVGDVAETIDSCTGTPPPAVCPEGTDNAGQEIPEGETAESFCTDEVVPPAVCAEGTDHAGQVIPEGQTAEEFCTDAVVVSPPVVSPPKVNPPKKHHTTTVTPTVVHAGLAGATAQDMRSEQGLALMFAGMLMLVAAGGLGLRVRGESRI